MLSYKHIPAQGGLIVHSVYTGRHLVGRYRRRTCRSRMSASLWCGFSFSWAASPPCSPHRCRLLPSPLPHLSHFPHHRRPHPQNLSFSAVFECLTILSVAVADPVMACKKHNKLQTLLQSLVTSEFYITIQINTSLQTGISFLSRKASEKLMPFALVQEK